MIGDGTIRVSLFIFIHQIITDNTILTLILGLGH